LRAPTITSTMPSGLALKLSLFMNALAMLMLLMLLPLRPLLSMDATNILLLLLSLPFTCCAPDLAHAVGYQCT
jgi:hypothetical protein